MFHLIPTETVEVERCEKAWQKRFCCVQENTLLYFKDEEMTELKGNVDLSLVSEVREWVGEGDKVPEGGVGFSFEQGGREWGFAVVGGGSGE